MILLNYQESTTEKFFENARDNLSFLGWGGGKKMIVLKYQDSTTDKFFERARGNLFFFGGDNTKKRKWGFGGSRVKIFSKFLMSQIDMNNIFPGCSHILWNKI